MARRSGRQRVAAAAAVAVAVVAVVVVVVVGKLLLPPAGASISRGGEREREREYERGRSSVPPSARLVSLFIYLFIYLFIWNVYLAAPFFPFLSPRDLCWIAIVDLIVAISLARTLCCRTISTLWCKSFECFSLFIYFPPPATDQ